MKALKNTEQKYSKFQWFVMVIFIPIMFAILLFSIILSFMGISVVDQAKQVASNIPVLSNYVKTEDQIIAEEEKANIDELMAIINARETELSLLEQTLSTKEEEILSLLNEIEILMGQLEEKKETQLEVKTEYIEIAKLYETMSAKNAANILTQLSGDEAAIHLSFIKIDARAAILAKMAPDKAAELISLLSDN
ncbi:MotE family protein [Anaerobacillus alkalidiazotrophicus]|nr:MotE family protein [Anaerobacillus alkalidiazotrophicus]